MPVLSDCHLHSVHSGDCDIPMAVQAAAASARGLKTICFTEHLDHNYRYDLNPEADCSFDLDIDAYRKDFLRLRGSAPSGLEVLFGIELGLMPDLGAYYADVLRENPDFDFVIGSCHLIDGYDPYYGTLFERADEKEVFRRYFENLLSCVKAVDSFDSLGHLDYVVRYGPSGGRAYAPADYREIIDEILRTLIRGDKALEVNTKPLSNGFSEPNPAREILLRYRELGGKLVTVGADAHVPEGIAYGFEQTGGLLLSCGFDSVAVYRRDPLSGARVPEEYGI